jgi:hypothetical protein
MNGGMEMKNQLNKAWLPATLRRVALAVPLAFALAAGSASAATVLSFEGLQDQEQILDFYNGGTGSMGSSGANYGISFGSSALALIDSDAGGSGNFANEPSADTIAFFLSGGNLVMNVAAGFTTGFSFYYTSAAAASVSVYDGLNASGNLLGTINLVAQHDDNNCTGDPSGTFCNWTPVGVAFGGTAMSVSFAGAANQAGFDEITLGRQTPGDVPEPGTLALLGIGLGLLRARAKLAAKAA